MGRPKKRPEDKRQQIGLRLDPAIKEKLLQAAGERSLAQEIERRLLNSLRHDSIADDETNELLSSIAEHIHEIHGLTKKHWYKDVRTWAIVKAMLSAGPINELRPDKPFEDELVMAAFERVNDTRRKKLPYIRELEAYGINAPIEPPPARHGLLRSLPGGRYVEAATIDHLELPDEVRCHLHEVIESLKALDEEHESRRHELFELAEPYLAAERLGQDAYDNWKHVRAMEDIKLGRDPNPKEII